MPQPDQSAPTLRVTTNEVLVPTLVEKRGGGIVYGLKQGDFILEDNGVAQKIRVQEEMETNPLTPSTARLRIGEILSAGLVVWTFSALNGTL